jgi:lipid A ethanolaminephosphotransferase
MRMIPNVGASTAPRPAGAAAWVRSLVFPATVEQVLLATSLFWVLTVNRPFFAAALAGRPQGAPTTWAFAAALAVVLVALHVLLLGLVANRWTVKPLLTFLLVATAFASYFMQRFGIYLDPSMLRNVLRTDTAEAGELMSWGLLLHLVIYGVTPLLLLWRVRIVNIPWLRAAGRRLVVLLLAGAILLGTLLTVSQTFASLMRNHKEVRYLITPANYLWSLGSVLAASVEGAAEPRRPIGLDAAPGPSWSASSKPLVVLLVVGETVRAASWGLNGYARQTTPELARRPVINFSQVESCGTDTDVSLPCMFAPVGRRDYDAARIRGSESLLHVVARAGVAVHWRENQSGCKGVCAGLPNDSVEALHLPGLCADGRCLDEGLLSGLDERLADAQGTQLLVLHQLGNHGPSYYRRYPEAFARFRPACEHDDLSRCSREEIVNAYDNAVLYTDHLLASAIDMLEAHAQAVDAALLYVSDHGESLGENNLFLHGILYAIAPSTQKEVPMVLWLSQGFRRRRGIDMACLQRRAALPARHDHLFHTLLGMVDVTTALRDPAWDLLAPCSTPASVPR